MYIEYDCSKIGYRAAYAVYDSTFPVLPVAAFSATPLNINAGDTVQFTDESTPGSEPITSWRWDFGDGNSSTSQNPSHTYVNPSKYSVSLEVTTSVGTDQTTKNNYITVMQAEGESVEGEPEGESKEWLQVTDHAPWTSRSDHGFVTFKDRLWILGGVTTDDTHFNDVWSSTDGINWTEITSAAPWHVRAACFSSAGTGLFPNKLR